MCINAQVDDIHVNVRLYPVQMLTLNDHDMEAGRSKENAAPEINSVVISSASGFQLRVQHDNYNEYNLINSQNGVVEKRFNINQKLEKKYIQFKDNSNFMMLTLISQ